MPIKIVFFIVLYIYIIIIIFIYYIVNLNDYIYIKKIINMSRKGKYQLHVNPNVFRQKLNNN